MRLRVARVRRDCDGVCLSDSAKQRSIRRLENGPPIASLRAIVEGRSIAAFGPMD